MSMQLPDWVQLVNLLWQGFQLIGDAVVIGVKAFFGLFGVEVPDWMIQVATIIILLLVVFKFGKWIGKIILIILLLLLASTVFNLFLG